MLNRQPLFIALLGSILALGGCASAPSETSPAILGASRTLVIPHGFSIQQAQPQGQPLSADEAQRQLPGRISAEDASRLLVFIDPSQVATPSAETSEGTETEAPPAAVPSTQTP